MFDLPIADLGADAAPIGLPGRLGGVTWASAPTAVRKQDRPLRTLSDLVGERILSHVAGATLSS